MGNMVTFSIRHDLMHLIQTERFADISDLMNEADIKIKVPLPSKQWLDGFTLESALPGVISSQYHHSEDGCDLLVSNQWLTVLPWSFNLVGHRKDTPWEAVYPPELALKAARALVSNMGGVKLAASKQKPAGNLVRSAYTVFGFKTDYCHDLERNAELVAHILQHCRTGQPNKTLKPSNYQIESLGTYDADTSVVVHMSRGSFSVIPVRYAPLDITREQQQLLLDQKAHRNPTADKIMQRAKVAALCSGLGFDLLPKTKTLNQERPAWEPR
jgi:hypothetical protein